MGTTTPGNIRSIALIAHGGAGKTGLIENLLFQARAIAAKGSVDKGTAVMFTEPEEVSHKIAITPHVGHLTWKEDTVYFVDAPGYFNFLENTRGVLPGVDGAVFLISGTEGVKPESERLWQMLSQAEIPVIGFVTKLEQENTDLQLALSKAEKMLQIPIQPITLPIRKGVELLGYVDLLRQSAVTFPGGKATTGDIPAELKDEVATARTALIEKIAENSDELIEKYLEGAELSEAELLAGLRTAVNKRAFIPVLCGSEQSGVGTTALLDAILDYLPSPLERDQTRPILGFVPGHEDREVTRKCAADAPFAAQVLKTTIDPFSGKLSIVRVFSGQVRGNQQILNSSRQHKQKAGHTYLLQGKELIQVEHLSAGQIGAIAKLDETHTGETVCDIDHPVQFRTVKFADPPITYAVEAEGKTDDKVASGFLRLADEDPSLRFYRDEHTHEMILGGMGQTHIEISLERLGRKFGAKAKLHTPKVPYRETIKKTVKVQGKVKKQSGGHGQFANCWLEIGPLPRDAGFVFEDNIVGGVIPRNFIPSIKKGIEDSISKGFLGGFPVVDFRASVYDGSYHDVDSSDYAFQVAGSLAFKAALEQGSSTLLEPIMGVNVYVPEECTGDVMKDISSRRGKVLNLNAKGDWREIETEIPMAEIMDYGHVLSAMTSGRGQYTAHIISYHEVPGNLAAKVLEGIKTHAEVEKGE